MQSSKSPQLPSAAQIYTCTKEEPPRKAASSSVEAPSLLLHPRPRLTKAQPRPRKHGHRRRNRQRRHPPQKGRPHRPPLQRRRRPLPQLRRGQNRLLHRREPRFRRRSLRLRSNGAIPRGPGAIPPRPLRRLQRPDAPPRPRPRIRLRPPRRHLPHRLARAQPIRLPARRERRRLWRRPRRPHGRLQRHPARRLRRLRRRPRAGAAGRRGEDRMRGSEFRIGGCRADDCGAEWRDGGSGHRCGGVSGGGGRRGGGGGGAECGAGAADTGDAADGRVGHSGPLCAERPRRSGREKRQGHDLAEFWEVVRKGSPPRHRPMQRQSLQPLPARPDHLRPRHAQLRRQP